MDVIEFAKMGTLTEFSPDVCVHCTEAVIEEGLLEGKDLDDEGAQSSVAMWAMDYGADMHDHLCLQSEGVKNVMCFCACQEAPW